MQVAIWQTGWDIQMESVAITGGKGILSMKAMIDRDGCIGCGVCAGTCPDVFCIADDGLAQVCGEVSAKNEDAVIDAVASCPVAVITVA